jgi:ribosomal protein S18 acetylase RimI-like enzyme
MDFVVRPAAPADAGGIAEVIAAVEPELLVSEIGRDERSDRIHGLLESGENVWFVAEADGAIVGELGLALGDPAPASLGLSVLPSWRRRGIGDALLSHALDWARANAVHKVAADVFPENAPALSLLRKHGFEEEGRLREHYQRETGEPRDALLLGCVL